MAKLIVDDPEFDLDDNSPIREPCKELGVLFGCENGLCGTCMVKVTEGEENLSEKNDAEEQMMLEEGVRLACQCKIKKGTVKLKQE